MKERNEGMKGEKKEGSNEAKYLGRKGGRMGGKGRRMGKKEIVRRRKIDVGEINIKKRQAIFDGKNLYKELGKNNSNQEYEIKDTSLP